LSTEKSFATNEVARQPNANAMKTNCPAASGRASALPGRDAGWSPASQRGGGQEAA